MSRIRIVPREGSRRIGQDISQKYYRDMAAIERDQPELEEPFKEERFPGTQQLEIPFYYKDLRRFPFKDPTDPKLERDLIDQVEQSEGFEKLRQLAINCKLKNERGDLIKDIDIYDPDDDFLNHEEVFIKLDSGTGDYDDVNPMFQLMLLHLRARDEYSVGPLKNHPPMNRKVKYVIVDTEIDKRLKAEKRLLRKTVYEALDSLTKFSDKLKMCLALNLIDRHTANYDEVTLDNLLESYATDDKTIAYGLITKQEHFLEVFKKPKEIKDANFLYSLGVTKGFIKYNSGNWIAFGEIIGSNKENAVENLSLESYKPIYDRLAEACQLALEIQEKDKSFTKDVKDNISKQRKIVKENTSSKSTD